MTATLTEVPPGQPPRLVALLASGQILIPDSEAQPGTGADVAITCPGPDEWGSCSNVQPGERPICEGARWYELAESGRKAWTFEVFAGSGLCPAAILDPSSALRAAERSRRQRP